MPGCVFHGLDVWEMLVSCEVCGAHATSEEGTFVLVGESDGWDDEGLPVGDIEGSWFPV